MMNDSANLPFGGSKAVDGSLEPASFDDLDFRELHEADGEDEGARGATTTSYADEYDDHYTLGDEPSLSNEEPANQAEDLVVTLEGGEEVPLEELRLGYMRDRDYRNKTQDLANGRLALESMSSRVAATVNAVAELIAGEIPDEPPEELRLYDPQAYQRQWALHQAGLEQLARVMALGDEPAGIAAELRAAVIGEGLEAENAKLIEAFPQTGNEAGRQAFFADAFETARELGFSDEEVREVHAWHRGRCRGHLLQDLCARPLGFESEPGIMRELEEPMVEQRRQESREAMQRLSRTGSIRDAMAVDFE